MACPGVFESVIFIIPLIYAVRQIFKTFIKIMPYDYFCYKYYKICRTAMSIGFFIQIRFFRRPAFFILYHFLWSAATYFRMQTTIWDSGQQNESSVIFLLRSCTIFLYVSWSEYYESLFPGSWISDNSNASVNSASQPLYTGHTLHMSAESCILQSSPEMRPRPAASDIHPLSGHRPNQKRDYSL